MQLTGRTLSGIEEKILKNDLLDIQDWADKAIIGKINNCKKRMIREWLPKLQSDPTVNSIPGTEDELIDFIIARSDYKDRVARKNAEIT